MLGTQLRDEAMQDVEMEGERAGSASTQTNSN